MSSSSRIPYIDQVHLYLQKNPSATKLSAAEIQDLDGMHFRKAVIKLALAHAVSPNIPDGLTLWTEAECVAMAAGMIKGMENKSVEFIQDAGQIPFRKRIIRAALATL
jgi:hypothetical protein